MSEHTAEKDAPAPVPESDVWPVHRALGDWMWKDADAPRLSRDAQWRVAEWIVRRERESERVAVAALIETGRHNGESARDALARAVERLAEYDARVTSPAEGRS